MIDAYRIRTVLLVLFAIFLSVLVRSPTLNRPLSKHHEFCTAVSLRILQIWDEAGIATYKFNPAMTYPNEADKFINNYGGGSGRMLNENGNYYYVSHPPLAYYVPYFIFQLLGVKPDVLPVQVFNMLLHFISAVGIYLIVKQVCSPSSPERDGVRLPGLAAFILYLFSPATLWFQSNTYMSDMAVQPLFIFGVLFSLKFFNDGKHLIVLSLLTFLMTYTTWLGVFFAFMLLVLGIVRWKKIESPVLFLIFTSLAVVMAESLTIYQYSQIAGWENYRAEALNRFAERSGWSLTSFLATAKNYLTGFLPLLLLLGFVLFKMERSVLKRVALFAGISALPVLLLHVVLQDYSGHDFTALYGAVFLSVTAAIALERWQGKKKMFWSMLAAYAALSIAQYYYINRPGEISINGARYADFRDIGTAIAGQSSNDEVIFLAGMKPTPEIIFYAGRNIQQVNDENEAQQFLKKHEREKGILFQVEKNQTQVVARISASGF